MAGNRKAADQALGLIKQLEKAGDLTGKNASVATLLTEQRRRVIVVGTGKDDERNLANYHKALIAAVGAAQNGRPTVPSFA
ncbi:M17 family peptidase N-terminal domain-containing protein [Marinobacter sp.]|uniref:M17 family peptidase N-terminal domain-containing protein n=1 Tax=Marinobacter sp. TaxID=50741 RepID=UPI003A8E575E